MMSSSSSSPDFSRPCPRNGLYDVFLSFRGEDTRLGFTANLYHSLMDNKVYTFMDVELVGEDIEHLFEMVAISRMGVVVYSESFGSSDWCLRELEMILQRRKEKKMLIVPIFYKVNVDELKHLTGDTGKYLDAHIPKHGETAVQKWKDAITNLGKISGLSYKDRYERDFIAEVIGIIKRKLELEERVQTQGSSITPYEYDSGPTTEQADKEIMSTKTMVEDVMEKLMKKIQVIPENSSPADQLSYKEKYILLNMACFWVGGLKYAPNYVWQDHFNGSVSDEIKELQLRSFIKIERDRYKMDHHQLRDHARATLRDYYNDQGRQVWIWRTGEGANLLRENNKLLPQVEAICLNGDDLVGTEKCFESERLRNLPNLRFIEIRRANIAGNFEGALLKVSYLKVAADPFMHTIQNLSLENIVVLELSGSRVGDDWKWSTMKVASKMKDLNLSHCHELKKGPNFSLFPNLERLDVEGCDQLESMDVSDLLKLKDLDASKCMSLKDVYGLDRWLVNSLKWMKISGSTAIQMSPDLSSKLKRVLKY